MSVEEVETDEEFDPEDWDETESVEDKGEDEAEAVPSPEVISAIEGFDLVIEDRPVKQTRGPAKKELAWEEFLDFLKAQPGTTARVFLFNDADAAQKARSRARSMRSRMVKTQPTDLWNINAEELKEDGSWRVYATYEGSAPADLVAERARIHAERVARGHAIAATRFPK